MRIGIIGSRGIPNRYGGFEELAEHLSLHLVRMGHEVYVYSSHRHPYAGQEWKGVKILHKYDPEHRLGGFGQFIYDLGQILNAHRQNFDVILQLGYTSNAIWQWLLPRKARIVSNMDGLEWKRSKYGRPTQWFLRQSEKWVAKSSHLMIADSPVIEMYLHSKYKGQAVFIPYGANLMKDPDPSVLETYSVAPGDYHLILCRMEPENHVREILQGIQQSASQRITLVMGNIETKYGKKLQKEFKDGRIRFLHAEYNKRIVDNLRHFCHIYFHGHSVGGTNPSLLEAMACGALICAHDNPFNKAVLQENAIYFTDPVDVRNAVELPERSENFQNFIRKNSNAVRERFNWKDISEQYELVFRQVRI